MPRQTLPNPLEPAEAVEERIETLRDLLDDENVEESQHIRASIPEASARRIPSLRVTTRSRPASSLPSGLAPSAKGPAQDLVGERVEFEEELGGGVAGLVEHRRVKQQGAAVDEGAPDGLAGPAGFR